MLLSQESQLPPILPFPRLQMNEVDSSEKELPSIAGPVQLDPEKGVPPRKLDCRRRAFFLEVIDEERPTLSHAFPNRPDAVARRGNETREQDVEKGVEINDSPIRGRPGRPGPATGGLLST